MKSGFFGTIIGFVLAITGCFFMRRPQTESVVRTRPLADIKYPQR
ncbi:MAG TPA: hypothetical protein VGV59_19700 [Pyrinomonadaceae bacterium]|nr:hypothetical protein [Pyrinomonadaceae bacterium]